MVSLLIVRLVGVGEVWANMLHNVYAALVAEYGWSADAFTNTEGAEGNVVFMHLLMDALSLQPCSPTCELAFCIHLVQYNTVLTTI